MLLSGVHIPSVWSSSFTWHQHWPPCDIDLDPGRRCQGPVVSPAQYHVLELCIFLNLGYVPRLLLR